MSEAVTVMPGTTEFIKTGIAKEIPTGLVGQIYARSGMACKKGLAPANKVGVIDSDYRGEIIVALHNHSDKPVTIEPKDRIYYTYFVGWGETFFACHSASCID